MNALIRQPLEREGPMAANEAMIEASLASMQRDLDEVKTELRELRTDNRAIREKLEQKTEAIHESHRALSDKIDAVNTTLTTKMDQGFAACNSKIDALAQGIADLRGMQKAMFWVFGVVGSLVAIAGTAVGIGKALHWF
jgi:chromosome segregation ATPase